MDWKEVINKEKRTTKDPRKKRGGKSSPIWVFSYAKTQKKIQSGNYFNILVTFNDFACNRIIKLKKRIELKKDWTPL